ncbi:lysophospholipase [Vibrio caribbeanicus]|uniref:Lysophospholipase n=1 Tax=Vibrio caribbeanicus TaxID=701175 RepID=A0ACC4NTF3_9VIBR|nr:SGNH/GDSL hydrolase family protein [Vibrio caribbeanicus]KHD23846.1 lysophospholipase [Vibrio caribbeanicus]
MTQEQLLQALKENQCLDLFELYYANQHRSFYQLVDDLYQLRDEHGLSTRISALRSEIEALTEHLDTESITPEQFAQICRNLDLNQRAHKMSRFILTQDNHSAFATTVDLVMFGDSITEWGPWHDALSNIKLANRGLAGDTTSGMVRRLSTTTACQPKLVCVMAGINDLSQGYSVQEVLDNYRQMLEHWESHNIEVWVQSTLYVGERIASLNPQVTELNQKLEQLCGEKNMRFIDLNTSLSPEGFLPLTHSCDDLHLNSNAYRLWIDTLAPQLDAFFQHQD